MTDSSPGAAAGGGAGSGQARRESGDTRLAQGVGVGHGLVRGRPASWRRSANRPVDVGGRSGVGRAPRPAAAGAGLGGAARGVAGGGRATGAARRGRWRGAGGSGEVSTLTSTASWTSDDALRNSRMLLPSDGARRRGACRGRG